MALSGSKLVFQLDGLAGAGVHAGAAANAGVLVDNSLVINNLDGLDGATINAGTAAGALLFINNSSHVLFLFFCELLDDGHGTARFACANITNIRALPAIAMRQRQICRRPQHLSRRHPRRREKSDESDERSESDESDESDERSERSESDERNEKKET